MTLDIPENEQQVIDQSRADVQDVLPESNPFLPNSFLDALLVANGGRVFDFYRQLLELQKQLFIDTATDDSLDRLSSFRNITRNPAAPSSGSVVFSGTAGSVIPILTTLQSTGGETYLTQSEKTIAANSIGVTITRVGSTATATTLAAHNLATSVQATISGADQTEYNGAFPVVVVDEFTFTFTVTGSPATPATGTILAAHTTAIVEIESESEGVAGNLSAGAPLTLGSPISGVNTTTNADFDGISGGTDEESDSDFRSRAIEKWQNPNTPFNVAGITSQAKLIPGVTRVFVREITPDVGQVTIFFTRDDDLDGPIPSGTEVNTVKDKILEIKPAHTDDADVIVQSPVGVTVNFIIQGIDPGTTTMQDAIKANLQQLFSESTNVGVALLRNDYISAINRTVDTVTGDILQNFTITTPVGDVIVLSNQLPILGTVSFT